MQRQILITYWEGNAWKDYAVQNTQILELTVGKNKLLNDN